MMSGVDGAGDKVDGDDDNDVLGCMSYLKFTFGPILSR